MVSLFWELNSGKLLQHICDTKGPTSDAHLLRLRFLHYNFKLCFSSMWERFNYLSLFLNLSVKKMGSISCTSWTERMCVCLFPSKKSEWMNRYTWKPSVRKPFVKTPKSSSSLSTSQCVQRRILETIAIVAKTLRQNASGSICCGRAVVAVADGGGRRRVHGSSRRWQMRKRHEESYFLYLCNCTFQFALTPMHLV